MTSKNYMKAFTQLKNKPGKWIKYLKHNKPKDKKFGRMKSRCVISENTHGVIQKYGLKINRRYFRLNAKNLGFKKFN
jgi:ribosomal protein S14